MSRKKNRNDILLEDISQLDNEVVWDEYEYNNRFSYLCKVIPEKEHERLVTADEVTENMQRACVYMLIVNGRIFKIGKAEGTMNVGGFSGRVSSYNCGKQKARDKGTCSTTNYWVLQSLINLNVEVTVYAYFPEDATTEIFGETITQPFPTPKAVEGVVIKHFQGKYYKKPIGNTQR